MTNRFVYSTSGVEFRIVKVLKDMQDHSYMLKCITDKGKDLFMMCSVFAEELNKGKIVEIK